MLYMNLIGGGQDTMRTMIVAGMTRMRGGVGHSGSGMDHQQGLGISGRGGCPVRSG
jgi:hypothetical protein